MKKYKIREIDCSKVIFFFLISTVILILSCDDSRRSFPTGGIESPFTFSPGEFGVRFVDISPNSPDLDFIVATKKIASKMTYKTSSAIYNVGTGPRTMQVKVTQTPEIALKEFNITVEDKKIYTVVAYGKYDAFQTVILESVQKSIPASKSVIRFFHGSNDISGTVDIKISNKDNSYIIEGVNYGSSTEYWEVESGRNNIIITTSGTNNTIMTFVATLESGKIYTGFIAGMLGGTEAQKPSLHFISESDTRAQNLFNYSAGEARVRFIHASNDAPQIDFLVDNVKVLPNYPFKRASAIFKIKAGSRTIKLIESGTVLGKFEGAFNFEIDKSYTILATNNYSNLEVLVFENPDKSPGSDKANLRVVHSSANASSVYIKFATPNRPTQYVTLSFKGVSNYLELPAGLVDVVMYRAGTQDSVKYGQLYLDGGRVYTAYILGFISGTVGSPFSFDMIIDSDTNSQDLFSFF